MDGKELLKNWPEFANANAARILSSPAWRLETRYDGQPAVLTRLDAATGASVDAVAHRVAADGLNAHSDAEGLRVYKISLSVSFDDVSRLVTFAPSSLFPDLWELRDRLTDLPAEILLALVEKECGALFQFFEDVSRQSFSIVGLSEKAATGYSFRLSAEGGAIDYSVDLSPTMEQLLGQLANIDVNHESIRSLTREVAASYGALEMTDEEVAALKKGDCLVLPADAVTAWEFEFPNDALVRIVAPETRVATFAEIADETMGPVPPGDKVKLYRRGREIATGVFAKLGEATVVKIVE